MKSNLIVGKFWDPEHLMHCLEEMHGKGVGIYDVFSPFPIHGIEQFMGIKRTRLTIAAFIYAILGLAFALILMAGVYRDWGADWFDGVLTPWPMNIGGKPSLAWVDFVPMGFELTVLFCAHGMVLTFFIVSGYYPGKSARLLDMRQTDDVFIIAIDGDRVTDAQKVKDIYASHGAFEVNTTA